MLDHMSLMVSELDRSAALYDAALAPLGFVRVMEIDNPQAGFRGIAYGPAGGKPYFWIGMPTGEKPPVAPPPGFHVAFQAAGRAAVDSFHAAALKAGATDNGAPGLRPHYHADYYAAFVIDPDGYHVEAVSHRPASDSD